MVSLTPEQKNRESAMLWSIAADLMITFYMMVVGLFSGSVTVISTLARYTLALFVQFVAYYVMRRVHRGKFQEFEFGTGKIERIVNLLVAFALGTSCLYVVVKIFSGYVETPMSTSSLLLAMIGINLNVAKNVYFSMAFIRLNRNNKSVIISSQIKSRIAKGVASGISFCILITALWQPDPKAARIVDILGSVLIMGYMLKTAFGLIKESIPEILDRTVPEPDHHQILKILTAHFDQYDGFSGYRARRSGKDLFILLSLCFFPNTTLSQIETRLVPIRQALETELPGSTVRIIPEIMNENRSATTEKDK